MLITAILLLCSAEQLVHAAPAATSALPNVYHAIAASAEPNGDSDNSGDILFIGGGALFILVLSAIGAWALTRRGSMQQQ